MGIQLKALSHTSESPGEEAQRRRSNLSVSVEHCQCPGLVSIPAYSFISQMEALYSL